MRRLPSCYRPLCVLLLLAAAVGQGAIISPPKTAFQLREQPCWDPVREAIDNSGIEAAILQVMVNDTTVFTHAVGGVTEATQQDLWSASKLVASAAIMREVERGGLGLNDLANQHLDFWPTDPSDSRSAITLRHLLGFASGYTDITQTWGYIRPLACLTGSIQVCARGVLDQQVHTHPAGTILDYNSIHLTIAGAMVEAATGELIEQIVQRNVLDPADMVNTRYLQDPSLGNPFLAGGLVSTPGDYRLFLNALIGGRIVHAAETLDEIFSDAHPEASKDGFLAVLAARYGLGNWYECPVLLSPDPGNWTPECQAARIHSSPGASGAYPVIDRRLGYHYHFGFDGAFGLGAAISGVFRDTLKPLVDAAITGDRELCTRLSRRMPPARRQCLRELQAEAKLMMDEKRNLTSLIGRC